MHGRKRGMVPAELASLARQFAGWRQSREFGARIPERLWQAAVGMAAKYGLSRTASALKLAYYSLKERVDHAKRVARNSPQAAPTFVELPGLALTATGECVIEFEKASGDRMRMQLKGINIADLAAFGRDFWDVP